MNELIFACQENTRKRKQLLVSSLTQQVLKFYSPNKSVLIADLINNFAQKTGNVEYCLVSHDDSEIHAKQHGNLERHEVSKIENRVQ